MCHCRPSVRTPCCGPTCCGKPDGCEFCRVPSDVVIERAPPAICATRWVVYLTTGREWFEQTYETELEAWTAFERSKGPARICRVEALATELARKA